MFGGLGGKDEFGLGTHQGLSLVSPRREYAGKRQLPLLNQQLPIIPTSAPDRDFGEWPWETEAQTKTVACPRLPKKFLVELKPE